jgi:anti-sigma-K factor RskA
MAVEMTDIQNLLKNVDLKSILGDSTMAETTGGLGIGGGVLGAVLVGALLPRLLGDQNGTAAALAAEKTINASDVQNIVQGALNSQSLGNVEGEIWKAEGQLQAALQAQSNAQQIATLNAEIANIQGQGVITKAITEGVITSQAGDANIVNQINSTAYNTAAAIATSTAANLATTNALASQAAANAAQANAAILENKFALSQVTVADGEKTRASIALLAASIPNARELDLQRQLTVALDDHRHTSTRGAIESGNVSVITNVAQSQAQLQQQQQSVTLNGLLGQLIAAQHATNTAVTIGNGNRPTQTASNVNA